MTDMISREAAIAVATSCPDSHWGPWIAERLRALPAVQPVTAHTYTPSMNPNDQGECVICGGSPQSVLKLGPWNPVTAPGMTDLMVDPDSLDAFMEANPLPAVQPDVAAIREAALREAADSLLECSVWCDSQERTDDAWRNGVTDARKHHMARILALINNPGKEVMPDVEDTHHARPDTAPAGLSAGGGADYRTARQAIQKMLRWQGEYYVQRESADLALAFLDDMEARNHPAPRLLVEDGSVILTWVINGWKLYKYCDEEETQSFHWQGPPVTEGGA
ncbi:MAG: hypothetical protein ACK5PF_09380 [bacterium]